MVEVMFPNSIVNRSLHSGPDYSNLGVQRVVYPVLDVTSLGYEYFANDVKEKVLQQIEWYFSDENLRKDAFLMKHIARNKQGYVSLKLVASLRKIKSITKDCKMVADSIKCSKFVELSDDGTKVRRIQAVPTVDYSSIPKTIIITRYPSDNPDILQIQDEYSRYGQVSRVIILNPGKSVPLFVKSCKSRFPCIGKDVCILVEYGTIEMARKAYKECKQSWRQTATVQLLSQHDETVIEDKMISEKKQSNKKKSSPAETTRTKHMTNNGGYNSDSGYSGISRSPSTSPPPSRRFDNTPLRKTRLPLIIASKQKQCVLVSVIRTPLGPDGTKGFKRDR